MIVTVVVVCAQTGGATAGLFELLDANGDGAVTTTSPRPPLASIEPFVHDRPCGGVYGARVVASSWSVLSTTLPGHQTAVCLPLFAAVWLSHKSSR